MWRKGGGFDDSLATLVVIVLIVFLVGTVVGYLDFLTTFNKKALATIDRHRMSASVNALTGTGSAEMEIDLKNEYAKISGAELRGGLPAISINAEFLDEPLVIRPPKQYSFEGTVEEVSSICVTKQGLQLEISETPCELSACEEDRCSVFTGGSDGAISGYYCENGVYKSDGFYEHYYSSLHSSCAGQQGQGSFVEINRLACPNTVTASRYSKEYHGCVMEATWKCDEGDTLTMTMDVSQQDEDVISSFQPFSNSTAFACNGNIQHRRFFTDLQLPAGTYKVEATASFPEGSDSLTSEAIGVNVR